MFRIQFDHDRFNERVKHEMKVRGHTMDTLQRQSGVSHGTLNRLMHHKVRNIEAIMSVAEVLQIDYTQYRSDSEIVPQIGRHRDYIRVAG